MRIFKAFESFKEPSYCLYFTSNFFDGGATSMRHMIYPLLLYRLTGSATLLGVLALARSLPMFIVSPFAGAIADRVQKKYVVLLCNVSQAVFTLIIALSVTFGYLSAENTGSWWILITVVTFEGILLSLAGPSRLGMIPDIVSNERVMNAVALNQMGLNVSRIMTPAIAGFFIDAFGFEFTCYFMAIWDPLAVVLWLYVPKVIRMMTGRMNIISDIKGGLRYLKQETLIITILAFVLCVVFCSMPYQSLLPIFTEDILDVGASGLGVLQSVLGVGAIAGALILASLPNHRRGAMLLLSAFCLGLALMGFSFSKLWYLSLVAAFVVGIGNSFRMTLPMVLLQNYTRDEYRGRVLSFWGMEMGLSSFGAFFASILVPIIGVEWAIGGLALILIALSSIVGVFVPRLRKLD